MSFIIALIIIVVLIYLFDRRSINISTKKTTEDNSKSLPKTGDSFLDHVIETSDKSNPILWGDMNDPEIKAARIKYWSKEEEAKRNKKAHEDSRTYVYNRLIEEGFISGKDERPKLDNLTESLIQAFLGDSNHYGNSNGQAFVRSNANKEQGNELVHNNIKIAINNNSGIFIASDKEGTPLVRKRLNAILAYLGLEKITLKNSKWYFKGKEFPLNEIVKIK